MEYVILFFIGICATTLGTLAGGGGLINLPAMLIMGIPVHSAIAANKVSNTVSSFSSFFYLLKKKEISLKECYWIIPVSISGGITGGSIASWISGKNMYIVAIVLLLFALIVSFIGKGNFTGEKPLKFNKISAPGLYSIGIYDGLFGPGQGTMMLYLFGYLNIAYIRAVGLVRLATFSSCFGAAITYIATGKVIWPVTLALLLGSLSGAQIGVRIAEKLKPQYVKPILRIVTAALIVQIFVENVFS
ncbi:sulfite exporter TauE/SafE family protein [Bacillus sp. JJ1532]|uniref:sulfite exporter TauE/SafE family protein n=1 Tax=Bacillus sp. JJ1532 TaxID=3122958 RepID=UPI002FFDD7CF